MRASSIFSTAAFCGRWLRRAGGALVYVLCLAAVGRDLYLEARTEWALAAVRKAGGFYAREEGRRFGRVPRIDLDSTLVDDTGRVLRRGRANDAALPLLARFRHLRELSLEGAEVTDDGLSALCSLRGLRRLNLSGTGLTDGGLGHLKGLTSLEWIDLRRTKVTATGVEALRGALPSAFILGDRPTEMRP